MNLLTCIFQSISFNSNCTNTSKHRHYVFTINNPTLEDPSALEGPTLTSIMAISGVRYCVIGLERGIQNTPHFQGAISFTSPRSQSSVRKLIRGHIEVQRGTHQQARAYCQKDGKYVEWGTPTVDPGEQAAQQSTDWEEAFELAKSGRLDAISAEKRIRYYRTFQLIKRDYQGPVPSLEGVCGQWIYGPSGTGKSHAVHSAFPGAYLKDVSKWFCGYQGEDTIWIDDVDPSQSSWLARFLKIWADRYPFPAQVKGGSMVIRPKRVIITSNYSIDSMGFSESDLPAIQRRYVEVKKDTIHSEINFI